VGILLVGVKEDRIAGPLDQELEQKKKGKTEGGCGKGGKKKTKPIGLEKEGSGQGSRKGEGNNTRTKGIIDQFNSGVSKEKDWEKESV